MSITVWKPKNDIRPYHPAALDIETATDGSVLAIGFAWESETDERFYKSYSGWGDWFDDFLAIYKSATTETRTRLRYVYAHNGAGFDWLSLIMWAEQTEHMDKMEFIVAGGVGIGIDITFPRVTIHLRDSLRLMPSSLKVLSESFGVDNGKLDVPTAYLSRMQDYKREYPDEFWSYLRNDVYGLQEVIKAFWTVIYNKVGSIDRLPLTLPALAMKLWRMTLQDEIMTSRSPALKALERRSYTGGRTEAYVTGEYPVTVYDINSLYPSEMESRLYPASYTGAWVSEYAGMPGLYDVEYEQTNMERKAVLRDEDTQDFQYVGSGVYTQPEIAKFLEIGGTVRVRTGYVYTDMQPLFKDFIQDWYGTRLQAKRDGHEGLSYVCKILMNSLYGKFGQKEEGEKLVFWDADKQIEELTKGTEFKALGEFCVISEQRRSETTFVAVASYVTAYGRLANYAAMEYAEFMGGFVAYTDTDSQHVVDVKLPTGDELGELKEEFVGKAVYLGKKLYALEDGTIKAKGIGRDARDKMTFDLYRQLADSGDLYSATFTVFPSIRETLNKARNPNESFSRTRRIRAIPN